MCAFDDLLVSPPDLPVVEVLPRVRAVVDADRPLVLTAPPGSGKTTLVPPLLASVLPGRIIVTQPRRIAVRAAARRLASLLGCALGDEVGYAVRGDAKASARMRVEFVTPGVLLRRLQRDPELAGVSAVMIDEFHERRLDTDLLLAFLLDVRDTLRPDLHLSVASATLEAERTAALLGGDVEIITASGALYPLEVRWSAPPRGAEALTTDSRGAVVVSRAFLAHVARTVEEALDREAGDVLVFLPGAREIDEVANHLGGFGVRGGPEAVEVLALHASLPPAAQDRVLTPPEPGAPRRVVLSTSVAESSLTVSTVRVVVDAALSREARIDAARGANALVTVPAAKASCEQRAGRAARLGPGVAYRCMDEVEWARRRPHPLPEILTADLTDAVLQACAWDSSGLDGLRLLDAPPSGAHGAALERLTALGALDRGGTPTALGKRIARMPLDPGLACALVGSAHIVGADRASRFVALLSEDVRAADGDLARVARTLARSKDAGLRGRIDAQTRRLRRLIDDTPAPTPLEDEDALAMVVARAHPGWIARARGASGRYRLVDGQGAELPANSPLIGEPWLAVADLALGSGRADATIRLTVPISEEDALAAASHLRGHRVDCSIQGGRIRASVTPMFGAIPLGGPRPSEITAEGALSFLRQLPANELLSSFTWSRGAQNLRARLAALHDVLAAPWPDVSDEGLAIRLDTWITPHLHRLAGGAPLSGIDMEAALRALLPWPEASRLDDLAPSDIEIPTGAHRRIDWSSGRPVLALRVQEAFGWVDTPTFADGRLPLVLHLTDPAGRPAAVTSDLASFWAGPYRDVRAQLRGRYPKHPWPEDPFTERPTSRAKPRC